MPRAELVVELEQLVAEAALCRVNLSRITGALEACRQRLAGATTVGAGNVAGAHRDERGPSTGEAQGVGADWPDVPGAG